MTRRAAPALLLAALASCGGDDGGGGDEVDAAPACAITSTEPAATVPLAGACPLAQRLGVQIVGRHTALGDAIVTAEVFLKLVPLLADKGIHTLGQAREAAQKSRFARVQY